MTAARRFGVALGSWQEEKVLGMMSVEGATVIRDLRGRAKQYAGRYQRSFYNLIGRLERTGCAVYRRPGIRGGEWSARYWIVGGNSDVQEPPVGSMSLAESRTTREYGQDEADGAACRAMATALAAVQNK